MEGSSGGAGATEEGDTHNINRRAIVRNGAYLWPRGIVPYVLDSSLSELLKI